MTISSSRREGGSTVLRVWQCGYPGTQGLITVSNRTFPCALGRSGIGLKKSEGDGQTPVGRFSVRRVHFRPDRVPRPVAACPVRAIRPDDGWCDDSADPTYNRLVRLPFSGSHETLWRADHLYDVFLELGYNDTPPRPGLGSAIFLHLARPDFTPTEGCVAVSQQTMRLILAALNHTASVDIRRAPV